MNEDDKRKLAEHLLNQLEQAETSLTGLEQRLSDEEDARLGHKLINLAGHFAVETGKVEGRSLFEAYEWSQEREKTDADARALFRAWSTSWSREEFAEKMGRLEPRQHQAWWHRGDWSSTTPMSLRRSRSAARLRHRYALGKNPHWENTQPPVR
ncbi:hypothetical protein [Stutzerimonas nitrititolerans]|uniref:hypothetical protein n=1 Tax=Stutzerimonas nitrititolerans TaxID=2482751 RepID=UPI00289DAAA6|nr:hypothetical protein [Stutzerimonas nitrititolerans]